MSLPDPPETWAVVVKPSVGCATGVMYRALDDKTYPWREFPEGQVLYNDFERTAPCECLDLIEQLQMEGASAAGMSGSGSAVFGLMDSRREAEQVAERYEQAYAVKFLSKNESMGILRLESQ